MRELITAATAASIALVVWLLARKRREARALPPPPQRAVASSAAEESTATSFDGAPLDAPAGTPRERRFREIEDREQTGLCLYCDRPATRQVPQVQLVLSWFDRLYRKFNRVPANEWVIDVHPDLRFPHLLCEQHQPIARSYLEGVIAEEQAAYAHFVEKQRRDMYEFVSHGLDERMVADANAIKGVNEPKGRRRAKPPATVSMHVVEGGKKAAS